MPRLPEVFAKPVMPRSSSSSRATPATRTASANVVPGWGSRSIRSSSGWSHESDAGSRRTGHGWKVSVPMWAHQTGTAISVGQISSAVRPDGKVMVAVSR